MVDTFTVFYAPIMSDIIEEAIVEEGKNQYDLVIGGVDEFDGPKTFPLALVCVTGN